MTNPTYSFRVFWSEEDDAFIASCPEFPGISGIGDTAEEAVAEAKQALELAIETYRDEGWPLPDPTILESHSGQFRVRVPRSLHAMLAEGAEVEGVSLNSYVISLLAAGVVRERPTAHYRATKPANP